MFIPERPVTEEIARALSHLLFSDESSGNEIRDETNRGIILRRMTGLLDQEFLLRVAFPPRNFNWMTYLFAVESRSFSFKAESQVLRLLKCETIDHLKMLLRAMVAKKNNEDAYHDWYVVKGYIENLRCEIDALRKAHYRMFGSMPFESPFADSVREVLQSSTNSTVTAILEKIQALPQGWTDLKIELSSTEAGDATFIFKVEVPYALVRQYPVLEENKYPICEVCVIPPKTILVQLSIRDGNERPVIADLDLS